MIIAGIAKSSVIDYPDTICTVLFTGGCNLRCSYCHNPELISFRGIPYGEETVFDYIKKRKKFIDAVCISGGEPCLQTDLYDFIERLKEDAFKVKLDTNGTCPDVLRRLISSRMLDYIAMDVKAPFEKYHAVTGSLVDINALRQSIDLVMSFDGEYEFRTTVCKPIHVKDDLIEIAKIIRGSKRYFLQNYKQSKKGESEETKYQAFTADELEDVLEEIKDWFGYCALRKSS